MFGKRRNVGGIWLVIAIVIFLPAALFGGIRTFDAMTSLLLNYRTGTWLVVEAQEEYHMMRLAALSFQLTPDEASRDHLKLRFDVFWSRIPLILDSDEGEGVRRIPKVASSARMILDSLPILEQELDLSRGADAGADHASAGQGAVDAVEVAACAAGDAGDARVHVGLNVRGRAGVAVGVAADET